MTRAGWPISLLLLAACAARPVGDDAGVTTMVGGDSDSSQDADTSSEVGPTTFGTSGDGDGDTGDVDTGDGDGDTGDGDGDSGDGDGDEACEPPLKLDLPPDLSGVMPDSCTVDGISWPTPDQYPGCEMCEFADWCFNQAFIACVTPEPGQTCDDICPSGNCIGEFWNGCDGEAPWEETPMDTCGPYEINGECCTIGSFFAGCAE